MDRAEKQMAKILRAEGIMAQGYGISPKIVMRDKRLSTTAKAIYGYLASFAGGGSQAFPSRDIMLDELQISKDTYYKHMKQLTDADYIRVERTKGSNGAFGKNVYTIVALPNPQKKEGEETPGRKPGPGEKNEPAGNRKSGGAMKRRVKGKGSGNGLRERLRIDSLKETEQENAELIEEVFMAVEDMDASEQLSIGGAIKKKEAIQSLISRLTDENISMVANILKGNKKALINRKSYIQACLANSIFELHSRKGGLELKRREEGKQKAEAESIQEEQKRIQEGYRKCPALKEVDIQMTEIIKKKSRALLSGNKILLETLQGQYEQMAAKRERLVQGTASGPLVQAMPY